MNSINNYSGYKIPVAVYNGVGDSDQKEINKLIEKVFTGQSGFKFRGIKNVSSLNITAEKISRLSLVSVKFQHSNGESVIKTTSDEVLCAFQQSLLQFLI